MQGLTSAASSEGEPTGSVHVTPLLWEAAQRHGLGGLVAAAVQGEHTATPSEPLEKVIEQTYVHSVGAFLRQQVHLERILSELGSARVDVAVLKGLAIAGELYPRPELRPVGDIDLLARPEQYARLFKTLCACGFEPVDPSPELPKGKTLAEVPPDRAFESGDRRLTVEVHFTTLQTGLLERYLDAIWTERRWLPLGGVTMPVLSREHTLLMLALHAHKHSYRRLVWMVDLYLALHAWQGQIGGERLAALARGEGVGAMVHHAFRQVERVFGAVPGVLPALHQSEWLLERGYQLLWPLPRLLSSSLNEHHRLSRFEPRGESVLDVIGGLLFTGRRKEKWQLLWAYSMLGGGAVGLPD
ncbi:MAG: nucleotidyltransferase family protein [Chloroflexi bacterium]|nr:nucleotidyltransferase family protein [Chloroflexota bacterium]